MQKTNKQTNRFELDNNMYMERNLNHPLRVLPNIVDTKAKNVLSMNYRTNKINLLRLTLDHYPLVFELIK